MQTELSQRWINLLTQCARDLSEQLANQEWEKMAKTDEKIAKSLHELSKLSSLPPALLDAKSELKKIHDRALRECINACEQSRVQLLQQLQYAEARTAYAQSEHYFK
jgi:hypothetical protein